MGHYTRWKKNGSVGDACVAPSRVKIPAGTLCAVETCERPAHCRGWCKSHYSRWERHGDVQAHIPIGPAAPDKVRSTCTAEDCDRPVASNGMCRGHAWRVKRYGSPDGGKPVGAPGRGTCSADGCSDPHYIKGHCTRHHARVQKYGSLDGGLWEHSPVILAGRGKPPEQRFWDRVDKNGPLPAVRPDLGPCWEWTLSRNSNGYGQTFLFCDVAIGTHRVAWHLSGYELIPGMELDHLCRNPGCCRPEHLDQVPKLVNMLRGNGWSGRNYRKTHCAKGHEYDLLNTAWTKAGHRKCRTCVNGKGARMAAERALTREERAIARAYREAIASDPCHYCGAPGEHVDHFYPIDKGGSAAFWNLVKACARCNCSKGTRCGTWFALRTGARQPHIVRS